MDHVALVQRLLHGGEGQEDALFRPSADVHPGPLLDDSHDLVVDAVDADVPAAGVLVAEEGLVDARSDEAYFAFLAGIDLVKQSAEEYALRLDAEVGRVDSFHVICAGELAVDDVLLFPRAPQDGRDGLQPGYFAADALQVTVADLPLASFVEAAVRLAGAVGNEEDGVCGESVGVFKDGILEPRAKPEEDDQHEYAPKDSEAGQQAARLVAGDGDPYLCPSICVEKHIAHCIKI